MINVTFKEHADYSYVRVPSPPPPKLGQDRKIQRSRAFNKMVALHLQVGMLQYVTEE